MNQAAYSILAAILIASTALAQAKPNSSLASPHSPLAVPPAIHARILQLEDERDLGGDELIALLKDKSAAVRERAALALGRIGDARAGRIVVLEVERNVIGYLVAWPEDDAYFIENIGIEPHLQGKGWGRRLMDHAATEAAHLGLNALRLYTNAAMIENLSMYAHLGFVETHRVTEDGFNRVYMCLNLAEKPT